MHNSMESDWDQNVSGQKRELCVFSVSIPAIWKFFTRRFYGKVATVS